MFHGNRTGVLCFAVLLPLMAVLVAVALLGRDSPTPWILREDIPFPRLRETKPGDVLIIHVQDSLWAEPVPDASCEISGAGGLMIETTGPPLRGPLRTDALGDVEFYGASGPQYDGRPGVRLRVSADGFEERWIPLEVPAGIATVVVPITARTVMTVVVLWASGDPAAGEQLDLQKGSGKIRVRTDSEGRFSLPGCPPAGRYTVQAIGECSPACEHEVHPTGESPCTVVLPHRTLESGAGAIPGSLQICLRGGGLSGATAEVTAWSEGRLLFAGPLDLSSPIVPVPIEFRTSDSVSVGIRPHIGPTLALEEWRPLVTACEPDRPAKIVADLIREMQVAVLVVPGEEKDPHPPSLFISALGRRSEVRVSQTTGTYRILVSKGVPSDTLVTMEWRDRRWELPVHELFSAQPLRWESAREPMTLMVDLPMGLSPSRVHLRMGSADYAADETCQEGRVQFRVTPGPFTLLVDDVPILREELAAGGGGARCLDLAKWLQAGGVYGRVDGPATVSLWREDMTSGKLISRKEFLGASSFEFSRLEPGRYVIQSVASGDVDQRRVDVIESSAVALGVTNDPNRSALLLRCDVSVAKIDVPGDLIVRSVTPPAGPVLRVSPSPCGLVRLSFGGHDAFVVSSASAKAFWFIDCARAPESPLSLEWPSPARSIQVRVSPDNDYVGSGALASVDVTESFVRVAYLDLEDRGVYRDSAGRPEALYLIEGVRGAWLARAQWRAEQGCWVLPGGEGTRVKLGDVLDDRTKALVVTKSIGSRDVSALNWEAGPFDQRVTQLTLPFAPGIECDIVLRTEGGMRRVWKTVGSNPGKDSHAHE